MLDNAQNVDRRGGSLEDLEVSLRLVGLGVLEGVDWQAEEHNTLISIPKCINNVLSLKAS